MLVLNKYEVFPITVPVKYSLKTINFFLVKNGQSLILIDAGLNNDDCWQALIETLEKNNLTLKDITHIFLTHHHIDHVGLVNKIVSNHSVPVYAHPLSFPRLRRDPEFLNLRVEFFAKLYEEMGCGDAGKKQVDYLKNALRKNESQKIECELFEITDRQSFMNFDVIEFPGHAPDQLALYDKKQKWLFSGDLLIEHISTNALVEPDEFGKRMNTLTEHANSLEKCLSLQIDLVYPGHGSLIKDPKELIKKRLSGIDRNELDDKKYEEKQGENGDV